MMLCRFTVSFAESISGNTIRSKLQGIQSHYILLNLPYHSGRQLEYTLRGLDKLTPASSKQDQRKPVMLDMLTTLHDNLNLDVPFDVATYAIACISFYGQIRLGELLLETQSIACFDPTNNPTVAQIKKPQSKLRSRIIHLPRTKIGKDRGEDMMRCRQAGKTNPINMLLHHIEVNSLGPLAPVTSFKSSRGQ